MSRTKSTRSRDLPAPKSHAAPAPATAMAAVRMLVATAGPFMVAMGWVDAAHVEGIATLAVSLGTAVYGLFKTHSRQKSLVASK